MKLGFLTAALPDNTLEQAAKWGAESGFQAIEIACWPFEKAARRYARPWSGKSKRREATVTA